MRRTESLARIVLMTTLVALAISGILLTKNYVGFVAYHTGEGGNIYEVLLDMRKPAFLWAGVYGVAVRFPGFTADTFLEIEGAGDQTGYYEENLLFDCLPENEPNEVFASLVPSTSIDWGSITAATPAEIDAYLNITQYDSFTQFMAAANTYLSNISVYIGPTLYTIPGTYTYAVGDNPPSTFETGILKDGSDNFLFVANILDNVTLGFDNRLRNYQMMIPLRNVSNKTGFYFFVDPNNNCPGGNGTPENAGFIQGTVTSSTGSALDLVIVDVGVSTTVTNASGFYNMSVEEGTYRIYAIKTGYNVYQANVTIVENETTIHNIVMTPINENTFTGVGPGQDVGPGQNDNTGPGEDDGPGEAPLVPLVEQPTQVEGTDYIISLNAIQRKLRVGNFLQEEIRIISFRESTTQVFFEITGEVADLIEMDSDRLLIAPTDQEALALTIFGRGTPGFYNGTLEITGDFNASIPILIELLSREQLPVQALFMEIQTVKDEVIPGEEVRFKTDLKNLLVDQQYPVSLFFTAQDEEGNQTIWSYNTNVFLRTSFSLLKSFPLPEDIPQGTYIIRVSATYLGFSSGTSTVFEVVTPFFQRIFLGLFYWQWALILLAILLIALAAWYIRRRIEANKRFHLKVDYSQLPKPGPRSGWWGKIAETDHKTYFDLEQLKIHSIVAGSTGGGKSISAQVIIEECLLKDVAIICFDPTAQWSGMLRPCKEKGMLKFYPGFNMTPKQARAFNGNVRLVTNAREIIEINKYMKPGEIQIFAMNKLPPKDIDTFVANTIRQVFKENFTENPQLRLMLVYDEIHRILPKFGGSGDGFVQIERGCREFRKWGLGIMLVSQVLADFVGQIKANINTEVQMRTRDEGDLERIKTKYGDSVLKSLVKASVGSGMVQNASYNRGKPYFVTFRPILHSVQRLSDEELEKYNKYNEEIDQLSYELEQLEELEQDVFDMKLELKLSLDKVKSGNFNMVEVYLEGLRPRIKKEWEKLGKKPKKKEIQLVSEEELAQSLKAAKKSREDAEANEPKKEEGGDKKDEDTFSKEVAPDKILNLVNGMLVISMKGLYDELSAMKASDFEQHVNANKNEFATWVRDAVGDADLAQRIALKKDKQEILDLLDAKKAKKKMPALTAEEKKQLEGLAWFKEGAAAPAAEAPKEAAPVEKKEGEATPAEAKPAEGEAKKEEKPAEDGEAKTEEKTEDKPSAEAPKTEGDAPPAEASQEAKPAETQPAETKPAEAAAEAKPEEKPAEVPKTEDKKEEAPAEQPPAEEKKEEPKPADAGGEAQPQQPPAEASQEAKPAEGEKLEDKAQEQPPAQGGIEGVVEAAPDQYFELASGQKVKSVLDLVEALRGMNDEDFKQYVNEEKNDFASWIRGVFHNDGLADRINPLKSREETIQALQAG